MVGRGERRTPPDREQRRDRGAERRRVEQERGACTERRHDHAADGGADEPDRERPHEPLQRVRLEDQVVGDEVRDDRGEGRPEQRAADSEDRGEDEEVPQLQLADDCEHTDDSDGKPAQDVGRQQHAAPLQPVGDRSAEQHEGDLRHRQADADDRERGGRVGELVDLPGDRDEVDPVPEQGDREPAPEQAKVADPERLEDPWSAE